MRQSRAMLYAVVAFFVWVLVDTGIKLASRVSLSPFAIMGTLGAVGACGSVVMAWRKHELPALRPRHWREQSVICLCSLIVNYCIVVSLKHLPLTVYYIIIFTEPLAVAFFASLIKQEKLTGVKIGCLTAGFLGVVLAIGTKGLGGGEWIGYTAAFISVGAFVGYTIAMRHIAANATVENLLLPPFLTVGLVGFAGVVREGGFSLNAAIAVVVAAALLNLVANFLYNKALQVTVATNVMQLHYTQIVWGAIIGYAIWGEKPTWNLIAGSAIIIASGLVVATQAHRAEIPEQEKALAESEALGLRVKEALSKK